MVGIDELAIQIKELADLQIALAQRIASLDQSMKALERRTPVQASDASALQEQLTTLKDEAGRLSGMLEEFSSLDARIRTLESRPPSAMSDTYSSERETIFTKLDDLETRLRTASTGGKTDLGEIPDTLRKHEAAIENLTSAVQNAGQQRPAEIISKKDLQKAVEKGLEEIAGDERKRVQEAIALFENDAAQSRRKSEDAAAEQVKQFREIYASMQKRMDDSTQSFRQQTQQQTEDLRKRYEESIQNRQKEILAALKSSEETVASIKQRTENDVNAALTRLDEKSVQKYKYYDESFSETQKKVRDSLNSAENRVIGELKKESEKLRASVLENILDIRDRMKHVETVEENLENKVDAKLNEVSKTFADLFARSSMMLKEEIYEEITTELAGLRADVEKLNADLGTVHSNTQMLAEEIDSIKMQVADVASKKRTEDAGLLRDLEALERKLNE